MTLTSILKTFNLFQNNEFSYFVTNAKDESAKDESAKIQVLNDESLVNYINTFNVGLAILSKRLKFRDIIKSLSISDDGKTIVFGSGPYDRKIRILENADKLTSTAFNDIKVWETDIEDFKILVAYKSVDNAATGLHADYYVRISGNGKTIVDSRSRIWEKGEDEVWKNTVKRIDPFYYGHYDMEISTDGSTIMFVQDGTVVTYKKIKKQFFKNYDRTETITKEVWTKSSSFTYARLIKVVFSESIDLIVALNADQNIFVFEKEGNKLTRKHTLNDRGHDVDVSKDGRIIVTACSDANIKIWDAQTGECKHTLTEHASFKINRFTNENIQLDIHAVAISSDGSTVVSGGDDETVRVWNVKTGECEHTLNATKRVVSVAISADGGTIVYGTDDNIVTLTKITNDHIRYEKVKIKETN